MRICDACGQQTSVPAAFCENCGARLPQEDERKAPETEREPEPTEATGSADEDATQIVPAAVPLGSDEPEPASAGDEKSADDALAEDAPPPTDETLPPEDATPPPDDESPTDDLPASPAPRRRSPALVFAVGILGVLLVGGAAAGIYFGLVKDNGNGDGTESSAATTPSPTSPRATGPSTTSTTSRPDKPATFLVNVCGGLSPARRCEAPGFIRSRRRKQFFIWVLVRKAPKGQKVQILLKDASTGRNLVNPTRYTTTGASRDIFTLRISGGPFRPLRAVIRIKYENDFVKFPRVLRITLR
jgi:hypothetical protein